MERMSCLGGRGDHTVNLINLVVPDHISDGRGQPHNLKNRNIVSIHIRHQLLGNNSLQYHGKLNGNLMLLAGLENIHNTADGIGSSGGMKAGKNQMSGLSSSHGSLDSLVVTHFSKKNHIRALAQGGTQGNQIIGSIRTDLTLADNAFVMSVQVFQRVFQSDDMSFPAVIDLVDDAGHSCGFSASGRTGDQNHSFGKIRSFHNSWWNMQILGIRKVKCNNTDDSSKRTTLPVCIYTESGETRV